MKYVNGELILENAEEIEIAIHGVRCLQNTSKYALNAAQKSLPYKHVMMTPQEVQAERDTVAKLEKIASSAENFLGQFNSAKGTT